MRVIFKRNARVVAVIEGVRPNPLSKLSPSDQIAVADQVLKAERLLESLLGLRVHIEESR